MKRFSDLLIERGANVNQADKFGMTALHTRSRPGTGAPEDAHCAWREPNGSWCRAPVPSRRLCLARGIRWRNRVLARAMNGEVEMMRTLTAAGADWRYRRETARRAHGRRRARPDRLAHSRRNTNCSTR